MNTRELSWASAMQAERRGDAQAYERFLTEFATSLRRIVGLRLTMLGLGAAETEDIIQEVLIAVHSRRDRWDTARPLIPWLNAITRYKMIDAARRLRRDARVRIELSEDEWGNLADHAETTSAAGAADVERLLDNLPAGQKSVAHAIGIEGASPRETAERLGTTEGAVRVAFHRAIKTLAAAHKRMEG